MTKSSKTSNDLIDDLVRTAFGVGPEAMSALALGDEDTRLRRLPNTTPTPDPLDGVAVLLRRVLATSLAIRGHRGAVALLTRRQAEAAGWRDACFANRALVLAWALSTTDAETAHPVLVEAEEDDTDPAAPGGPLVRADAALPTLEELLAAQMQPWEDDGDAPEEPAPAGRAAPALRAHKLVRLHDVLRGWLGIDAGAVAAPSDGWSEGLTGDDARAAGVLAWIVIEAMRLGDTVLDERVSAVRVKTERDARLAGDPGATAAGVALLLGAASSHAAGVTLHLLPPRADVAAALVEAGRGIAARDGEAGDEEGTVDFLELCDLAARGYVHVGRRAVRRVAYRLQDAGSHRRDTLGELLAAEARGVEEARP